MNDEEILFESPRDFNNKKIPDETLAKLKELAENDVKKLEQNLGREATFEDYVRDYIEQTSFKKVDDKYNAIKLFWELIGRDTSKADEVYDKFFNSTSQIFNIGEDYLIENEQVENKLMKITTIDNNNYVNPETYDTKKSPIVDDSLLSKSRVNKPTSKIANSKCQKCSIDIEPSEELCSNCKSKKNLDDFFWGFAFLWVVGASGILALIRYLINPEISTEVILVVLFFGFVVVSRYLRSKKKI